MLPPSAQENMWHSSTHRMQYHSMAGDLFSEEYMTQ
jgi:hypothetical protein